MLYSIALVRVMNEESAVTLHGYTLLDTCATNCATPRLLLDNQHFIILDNISTLKLV